MNWIDVRLTELPQRTKRIMDFILTAVGSIVIFPFFMMIIIIIKLDSPGPVFYGHIRLGLNGKKFKAWKFRSMVVNADSILKQYLERDPELKREWEESFKLKKDPRITRVGKFLRKTSLDELPQIYNVLRGEMSLIGPRPIVDAEKIKYGKAYDLIATVRPGMTGLWQISGRSDISYNKRVELDTHYITNWSVRMDLLILFRTFRVMVNKNGAY